MKGKIAEDGILWLERGGKLKTQECRFSYAGDEDFFYCGDGCPHFGEPEELSYRTGMAKIDVLLTCGKGRSWTFEAGDFTDERSTNANEGERLQTA